MAVFNVYDLAILGPGALLTAFLSVRFSLGTRALVGLTSYVPTVQQTTGSKKQLSETVDTSSLVMVPMNAATVLQLPEYSSLESLLYSTLLMIVVAALYTLCSYLGWMTYGTVSLLLSASVFLLALVSLMVVSFLSRLTSAEDKIYCIVYSSVGFIGSIAYFAMEPKGIFMWSPEGAADAAASLLKSAVQKALQTSHVIQTTDGSSFLDNIEAPLSLLGVIFALLAAYITAVMHGSTLRFARAFHSHLSPPAWAEKYMARFPMDSTRLRFQMILPVAILVFYMNMPMKEMFALSSEACILAQSATLVLTGLLFILNSRILVARYLETAFIAWYTVKHGKHKTKVEKTAAYTILKAKADIVRLTSCKTAIQAIAPGVLYLSCGILSMGAYIYHRTKGDTMSEFTLAFVENSVGFVVSFVGVLWFIVCGFSLWLFRTGTLIY